MSPFEPRCPTRCGLPLQDGQTLSHEPPPGVTINNVPLGFTDTPRLSSPRGPRKAEGVSADDVLETWKKQVPEAGWRVPKRPQG